MDLERIPVGHRNAMSRPSNPNDDRRLREQIEKANNNGDCIINVGDGYYRPDPNDIEDALVNSGVLENDGWQNIRGFNDEFKVSKDEPKIEVHIFEVER